MYLNTYLNMFKYRKPVLKGYWALVVCGPPMEGSYKTPIAILRCSRFFAEDRVKLATCPP